MTDQALNAIASHPNIFQRKGVLVQVMFDGQGNEVRQIRRLAGCPRIRTIPAPWITGTMSAYADWARLKDDKPIGACVPTWVTPIAMARGTWTQFRHLVGVSEVPMLREDGSVIEAEGYDEETGIYYAPNANYPAGPENPTREDALAALARILDLVVDFPFAETSHRSAWLAGLLTPFTRAAFEGPVPLVLIDANVKGSGKGYLADIISKICTGRDFARCPQAEDPEEERKRITTIAIEGDRMVLFDDITKLGSKPLDAALTATTWKERILGSSVSSGELPLMVNWYATGNNVIIRQDVARRVLHVRLESPLERPEERTGFRHPDLMRYVEEHRASLAIDCLTILRAFFDAGRPSQNLMPWGSFDRWSEIVRDCVVWLGEPDPGETRKALREAADSVPSHNPTPLHVGLSQNSLPPLDKRYWEG